MTKRQATVSSQRTRRATYRLQFNRDFTLRRALELVPYLHDLGISHVYASPLLKACPGSTHGYDVCDFSRINPEIGAEKDLEEFVAALRRHDMGLVLDFVPNHMGIGADNPWWWDVLKSGPNSRFAEYFDIDWNPPDPALKDKVLVPVLGDEYERVLERGELKVEPERDEIVLRYFEHRFPITPRSLESLANPPKAAVAELNSHPPALDALIQQKHYRLVFWRRGDTQLNYRRFFNVATLAGIRVEDLCVFEAAHARVFAWHAGGLWDGIRIDHPDGLRNPLQYLERLRAAAPQAWIVVEKILEPGSPRGVAPVRSTRPPEITPRGEELPPDWPVAGTTGYDFLNQVGGLFIEPSGEIPLTNFYAEFTGEPTDFPAVVRQQKRRVLHKMLVAEVNQLTRRLEQVSAARGHSFRREQLREALIEVIVCFPVYRTYAQADSAKSPPSPLGAEERIPRKGSPMEPLNPLTRPEATLSPTGGKGRVRGRPDSWVASPITPADVRYIETAIAAAHQEKPGLDSATLGFIGELLRLRLRGDAESDFVMRFQQLTGPAMAKGVEDTAFYCFNRFVALNEVGGDPARFGTSAEQFHNACEAIHTQWPCTMLATSTHDTKRSEDVRARLGLLSEIPDEWAGAVRHWSAMNEKHRRNGQPDRNAEYLFYQILVGAWPLPVKRALAYMQKASREAKQHTSWPEPNAAYDEALAHFVTATLGDTAFTKDLERFVARLSEPGHVNSLAQTLIKLTAPGVPDIYQGNEIWDFSLVDPDNRRPVDFAARERLLAELKNLSVEQVWQRREEGLPKLWLIQKTLQFRRRHPELFGAESSYEPLYAQGDKAEYIVAFIRGGRVITIAPRLVMHLANNWGNTSLNLPQGDWLNELTGENVGGGDGAAGELFRRFPVALLAKRPNA